MKNVNILLFLLSIMITIFGSEAEKEFLKMYSSLNQNKVTIQAGVGPCTRFVENDKGIFEKKETYAPVYTDLSAEIGFSIPGVKEQMLRNLKFVDYMVSDHALFDRFYRYACDRYHLMQDSYLENAMQGYLASSKVKDLAALTVMVKTLYKEENMPAGLHNTWRQRFSLADLLALRENQENKKESFLKNYFPQNTDVGHMVLNFVLSENSNAQDVQVPKVLLTGKSIYSTGFFVTLVFLGGLSAGYLLSTFNIFNLLNNLKYRT